MDSEPDDRDDDYFAGLPEDIINTPGYQWTEKMRDVMLRLIFDLSGDSGRNSPREKRDDNNRPTNANRRKLLAYIAYHTDVADDFDLADALSLCSRRFWHDGDFLEQMRCSAPVEPYKESGKSFLDWFNDNFPKCIKIARGRIAKRFEQALAVLDRQQPVKAFDRGAEPLRVWLERLLNCPDEEKPEWRPAHRERLVNEAIAFNEKEVYAPAAETFKTWFLRMALQGMLNGIATYESAHPFDARRNPLDEWFVAALVTLPDPGILLRGYKSFNPRKGDFGQWFFGIVVSGAIREVKRLIKKGTILTPLDEWKEHEIIDYDYDQASDGWPRELLESALIFCGSIESLQMDTRRNTAFRRYAKALRMQMQQWMSYEEMALEFGTEDNARRIVSRAWKELYTLFGETVDVGRAVAYARERAPICTTREETYRLENCGPLLLAIYDREATVDDRQSDAWVNKIASGIGLPIDKARDAIREAWKVLLRTLDSDGKSFYDFKI